MKKLVLLFSILMLTGCASTLAQRQVYITQHPGLPSDVKNSILNQKIHIGMTKEQVIASWGKPDSINAMTSQGYHSEQWCYGDSTFLYFKDNALETMQYPK